MRMLARFLMASSFILHSSSFVLADGGAIRLSEKAGRYRITVFSTPTPLRAGPVDVSVLIQDAASEQPLSDVVVTVSTQWHGDSGAAIHERATTEAATNKLYYASNFDWPEPGWYSVAVSIDGPLGKAQVRFDAEAGEPLPPWLGMWPWVGWPVLCILLFAIHQVLVKWRGR